MADVSQKLIQPRFVQIHDGQGKAFVMLVTKEDDGEHLSGAVWCDDPDNALGLSEGTWSSQTQIGRGDGTKGASWSEIGSAQPNVGGQAAPAQPSEAPVPAENQDADTPA